MEERLSKMIWQNGKFFPIFDEIEFSRKKLFTVST